MTNAIFWKSNPCKEQGALRRSPSTAERAAGGRMRFAGALVALASPPARSHCSRLFRAELQTTSCKRFDLQIFQFAILPRKVPAPLPSIPMFLFFGSVREKQDRLEFSWRLASDLCCSGSSRPPRRWGPGARMSSSTSPRERSRSAREISKIT